MLLWLFAFSLCALGDTGATGTKFDLRVSLPYATHGYAKLRLSKIDRNPNTTYGGFFSYNKQMQHRWTNMSLHSVLKDVTVGSPNTFKVDGTTFSVALPKKGTGVSTVIFGDPCAWFTGDSADVAARMATIDHDSLVGNIACQGDVGQKLPPILNQVATEIDYWNILGDNFYDRYGGMTEVFFDQLNLAIKSKPLVTVIGNHDYWLWGGPKDAYKHDSFGNGFMQYYAQDVLAGKHDTVNFLNYSIAPQPGNKIASHTNFLSYKQIGDIGMIGYSCAYDWATLEGFFTEACSYFETDPPKWLFLMGHWNQENLGAAPNMDVPKVFEKLKTFKGCGTNKGFKSMYGHTHCNKKISDDSFMIGNTGYPTDCGNQGFVYMSSKLYTNTLTVVKFDVTGDNSKKLVQCMQSKGSINRCFSLGDMWLNSTATW